MKVMVTWEMCGYVDIPQAKTVEEAMKIFDKESGHIALPDGEYLEDSFQLISDNVEEMKEFLEIED